MQEVWTEIGRWQGCSSFAPSDDWHNFSFTAMAHHIYEGVESKWKKGARTLLLLACWEIWQERNHCTFRKKLPSARQIIQRITDTIELWRIAGARCLESPFGEPP